MIVQSFRSVMWVGAVAGAALSCYMVSLRVASERAALESVESRILMAKRDIRALDTELTTRGRVRQLERWNVDVLALSPPTQGQFLTGQTQLASLTARPPAAAEPEAGTAEPEGPAMFATVREKKETAEPRPILAGFKPKRSAERPARNPLLVKASAPAPSRRAPEKPTATETRKAKVAAPAEPKTAKAAETSKTSKTGTKPRSGTSERAKEQTAAAATAKKAKARKAL